MDNARHIEANADPAQECCAPAAKNGWLRQRNILIGVALAGGAGALVLGWDWLVAAGVASIIIAVAPCLVMCALGLCMSRMNRSGQTAAATPLVAPGNHAQTLEAAPVTTATDRLAVSADPASAPTMIVSESRT
jgi:hypothetical protein